MAKILIDGKEYDPAGIGAATLLDTLDLKKQTGLSMIRWQALLEELQPPKGATPEETREHLEATLDSADHMLALYAMFWLARRRGGDPRISFEDACSVPFTSVGWRDDEDDEDAAEEDEDPTSPATATAPDAAADEAPTTV